MKISASEDPIISLKIKGLFFQPMMCMKRKEVSSSRRSKTNMRAYAQDISGFVISAILTAQRRLGGCNSGGAPPSGGKRAPQEMLKTQVDPEMYMKTKGRMTTCLRKKKTFMPSCTPFYTEMHVFCENRRLFCHYLKAAERTPRFKMQKLAPRHFRPSASRVCPATPFCG